MKSFNLNDLNSNELKSKIKEMHQRINKLEIENYDLGNVHERQIYDAKIFYFLKFN